MSDLNDAVLTHDNLGFIKDSGILVLEKSSQEESKEIDS